jgi:hypothetical protein
MEDVDEQKIVPFSRLIVRLNNLIFQVAQGRKTRLGTWKLEGPKGRVDILGYGISMEQKYHMPSIDRGGDEFVDLADEAIG